MGETGSVASRALASARPAIKAVAETAQGVAETAQVKAKELGAVTGEFVSNKSVQSTAAGAAGGAVGGGAIGYGAYNHPDEIRSAVETVKTKATDGAVYVKDSAVDRAEYVRGVVRRRFSSADKV